MAASGVNRSVRGTDDYLTERAANPFTGRISPSLAGSPPKHGITYSRVDMAMATSMTKAEYHRMRNVVTRLPVLARPSYPRPEHESGRAASPLLQFRTKDEFDLRADDYRKDSGSKTFTRPDSGAFARSTKERVQLHGPRPARKARVVLKNEDRLTEARVAKKVQKVYTEEQSFLSQATSYGTEENRCTNSIRDFNNNRTQEELSKHEAPCKVLRLLSSELSQRPKKQGPTGLKETPCPALEEETLATKPIQNLKNLPTIRLIPPCLAGAHLSQKGVEYARRPISATWTTDCSTVEDWSPLDLGDSIGEEPEEQPFVSSTLLADPVVEEVCDLISDSRQLLANCIDFNDDTRESICALAWSVALVTVVIGLFQAVAIAWGVLSDNISICGQLCWLFPD